MQQMWPRLQDWNRNKNSRSRLYRENNYEECYDCGLKVNGLKELMKHKKEHHPKNIDCLLYTSDAADE